MLTEPGPRVGAAAIEAVEAAGGRFHAGNSPFEGPLSDRQGRPRVPAGVAPAQHAIDEMNWFVPGVVGELP